MKIYLYAALALLIAGLLAYGVHVVKKANRVDAAEAALATERKQHVADIAAAEHNEQLAHEVSDAFQSDIRRLESERRNVPVVRLCRNTAAVPASGQAASGSDAAATGHVGEEAAPDIGAALLDYGIDAEANMLQLERLQEWVRKR